MDSKYIATYNGDLYHWGIKGMKWGVRRYQNSDGSLTAAGRKRYTNPDGSLNEKGKKKFGSKSSEVGTEVGSKTVSRRNQIPDLDDAELQKRVNRLRNEDAYRDLSKKLGYGQKTELGEKIAELEEQKRYLELQRDIKNLTPKKVSRGEKLVKTIFDKVISPAATEAGKKFLSQYLTEAGQKILTKEAKKVEKTVEKSAERVKKKEEKKEAKRDEKANKREETKSSVESDSKVHYGTVEGVGNSSRKSSGSSSNSSQKSTVDADGYSHVNDMPVTSLTTTKNTSYGSSWVSKYNNTPISSLPSPNIAGYLPAPKDDDD